jgi:tRNA threonylcarbamoyladenosine biosynthesis protein TsaB
MNLLAVDTATSILSVALGTEQGVWYFEADVGLRHSELIMDSIDMLTRKAGLKPPDISGVVCMGGPGSFTGLRVGFSLAKGFALSLGIPFASIPTLDCMAYPFAMWPGLVVPVIDAKKNSFFCALYQDGKRISPFMDAGIADITGAITDVFSSQNPPLNEKARVKPQGNFVGGEMYYTKAKSVLLTGPDVKMVYQQLQLNRDGEPEGELFRLAVAFGGYARVLLDLSLRDIAKNQEMFNNNCGDYFSGPNYIRKSDAELYSR